MLEPSTKRKENLWKFELLRMMKAEPTTELQFFKDNKVQYVRIVTAKEINLEKIIENLQQGESILIIRKRANEEKLVSNVDEEMSELWYFIHFHEASNSLRVSEVKPKSLWKLPLHVWNLDFHHRIIPLFSARVP